MAEGRTIRKRKAGVMVSDGADGDRSFEDAHDGIFEQSPLSTPEKPPKRPRTSVSQAKTRAGPAKKYDNGNATLNKAEPSGQPPVWSIKRQPLCDTLPWYRAQQSAAYTSNKIVKGFMMDKEVRYTDRFGTEVVISGW